ncbi:uncharacterized protein LOC143221564 isoform X2 [Lasioglossum baleicum]
MTSNALEEKINKIRQQNEEIRRRHQEVEEDKKNAAKLNALVQMVPSSDWPERKEPPEFSNPPKAKPKLAKEKHEYTMQAHPVEGKKIHSFAHGEGPPPDPKYNFLADSEREEPGTEYTKEPSGNKSHNKVMRGNFKAKRGGRENHMQKDNKVYKGNYRDESQPGYDAWRAERNRIDEDRISRQRTAEGNWRREWDNDKMHIIDDVAKKATRSTLGDFAKKDHKDSDRRYHSNNNEYISHSRGGRGASHRGTSKNYYGNYDNRSHNMYDQHRNNVTMPVKPPLSPTSEERTVIATDSSIKVTVNQGNTSKGPVMSVKVNSPSIAGTGRVGPRQRTRVTYSHSDADAPVPESEPFNRQKSFEDKSKGTYFNNPKSPNVKRSHSQKKKEGEAKYPYQRKEIWREEGDANSPRYHENEYRTYTSRNIQKSQPIKSPKAVRRDIKPVEDNLNADSPSKNQIQCSNTDSTKLEREAVTEKNETLEVSELSDQIQPSNGESDIKNEDSDNMSGMEVEQVSTSLPESAQTGAENPEKVTKDDKNVIYPNENEYLESVGQEGCIASDAGGKLQENSMSSEGLVSNTTEPVVNESKAIVEPVTNESEANVESAKDESETTAEPLAESIPKMDAVSAESIVKSASIELASVELISSESVRKLEPVSSESVPKLESVSTESNEEAVPAESNEESVPAESNEESVSAESVPKTEPVSAELVSKIEPVPTEPVAKTESVSVELVLKVEPVTAELVPQVVPVLAELEPTVESASAESVPKVESVPTESAAKTESVSVELVLKVEPVTAELVPQVVPVLAELEPTVESASAESVPKVEPVPTESAAKVEGVPAESVPKVEPVPTESAVKVEGVPAELVPKTESVSVESVPKVDPVSAELVPKVEPISTESVAKVEPVPAESVPKAEPVRTESIPKVEPVPTELVPKVEPVSAELVPTVEPVPVESVPNESNNASKASATVAASNKEDHQLQISELVVKEDCDTVNDEIPEHRRTSSTKNEPASSLEAEANSVINTENQLVCGDESIDKQTLLADAEIVNKIDKDNERTNKKSQETSPENTHSMVENKETIEATENDARVEL